MLGTCSARRPRQREGWPHVEYLGRLVELEISERRQRRIERFRKGSGLPEDKTIGSLKIEKLPPKVRRQVPALCEGGFIHRAENVLAFGLPGRGKTHLMAAIGHELVHRGYAVLFTPAYRLVQRLLAAKRDLLLDRELKRLDVYDAVILDDLGYVQQDREEMEVLFTFLSERYERRSVMITSNLVFSQWDQIFQESHDDDGGDRPPRPSRDHPGDGGPEHSRGGGQDRSAGHWRRAIRRRGGDAMTRAAARAAVGKALRSPYGLPPCSPYGTRGITEKLNEEEQ